jgi:SAM-dependent methyltransferase
VLRRFAAGSWRSRRRGVSSAMMNESPGSAADADANQQFYDALWAEAHLVDAPRFNTWPLIRRLCAAAPRRLEVGPGLRPHLPLDGTRFVELSQPAVAGLQRRAASVLRASITALPFAAAAFELVCALDILEHVDRDDTALAELVRVLMPGGVLVISTPLHAARWSRFDELVGHRRRYDPSLLLDKLAAHRLTVEASAVFGMQPRASRLVDYGMDQLLRHRARAMWWYNRVIMPIGLRLQGRLAPQPGLIATAEVDEILLVCRRAAGWRNQGSRD